ncbi:hypothetical protein BJX70DRAFT_380382 [Aspergillus crustosus]
MEPSAGGRALVCQSQRQKLPEKDFRAVHPPYYPALLSPSLPPAHSLLESLRPASTDAVMALNTRPLPQHGFTPSELLFGFTPRMDPVSLSEELKSEWLADIHPLLVKVDELVDLLSALERLEWILSHVPRAPDMENKDKHPELSLAEGNLVLLWDVSCEKDIGGKLQPKWTGRFDVKKVIKQN